MRDFLIVDRGALFEFVLPAVDDKAQPSINFVDEANNDFVVHISFRISDGHIVVNSRHDDNWRDQFELPRDFSLPGSMAVSVQLTEENTAVLSTPGHEPFIYTPPDGCVLKSAGTIQFSDPIKLFTALRVEDEALLDLGTDESAASEPMMAAPAPMRRGSGHVMIVGSAPTIIAEKDRIASFKGDLWALNDALFWLEENGFAPDRLFVNDSRFIRKSLTALRRSPVPSIVMLDRVDTGVVPELGGKITVLETLGRDGFSNDLGRVFHGCSVFASALQCAAAMGYRAVSVVGVVFPLPSAYARIDGRATLPEFVHDKQLHNMQRAMGYFRSKGIPVDVAEKTSNLNFL